MSAKLLNFAKWGGGGSNVLNKTNIMYFPCFQPLTWKMFAIAESFNSKVKGGEGTGA